MGTSSLTPHLVKSQSLKVRGEESSIGQGEVTKSPNGKDSHWSGRVQYGGSERPSLPGKVYSRVLKRKLWLMVKRQIQDPGRGTEDLYMYSMYLLFLEEAYGPSGSPVTHHFLITASHSVLIWPGCLLNSSSGHVWTGKWPRTCWWDYISHLAWDHLLGISQKERRSSGTPSQITGRCWKEAWENVFFVKQKKVCGEGKRRKC